MKKIIILLILGFMALGQAWSQSLADAEYYFDSDPGVGNGILVAPFTGGDDITETYNFDVTGLLPGFHNLYCSLTLILHLLLQSL